MKKLINDPYEVVSELIEGMCMAYPNMVRKLEGENVIVRTHPAPEDHVRIVIGGGSGHEPVFGGFVGRGMADADASGDIFASPSADLVVDAVNAAGGGAGTILIYGNYQGDILNFDMAQEICRMDGRRVETVRVQDDVASAGPDNKEGRRGCAADLLVIKAAGAAAARGYGFDRVLELTTRARDNARTMGVALSSCTLPAVGKPIFELDENEMSIGMGLHGEPGVSKGNMMSADDTADLMLDHILADDLGLRRGDSVMLLVNGYGASTNMELFIVNRRVHQRLAELGIEVWGNPVGTYCSSQEMAGCSITLLKLDDELKGLFDEPAESPGYTSQKRER